MYSHLVSDHYHYWEDGGATYHNRYDTFEFIRGQERDPWKAMVEPPWKRFREQYHRVQFSDQRRHKFAQYMINREFIRDYADFPSVRCFDAGLEFLDGNRDARRTGCCTSRRSIRTSRSSRPIAFAPTIRRAIAGRSSTGRRMRG